MLATMLVALHAWAQAQAPAPRPDFTGVWVMDTTKFEKHDAELVALKLTVSIHGDTLAIVTDVTDAHRPPSTSSAKYGLDGKPSQNPMGGGGNVLTALVSWDGATLILSSSGDLNGRSLKTTERWSLDATAKTMTRQYHAVIGDREQSQTLLFTRQ